jgi:hypothetical protein
MAMPTRLKPPTPYPGERVIITLAEGIPEEIVSNAVVFKEKVDWLFRDR